MQKTPISLEAHPPPGVPAVSIPQDTVENEPFPGPHIIHSPTFLWAPPWAERRRRRRLIIGKRFCHDKCHDGYDRIYRGGTEYAPEGGFHIGCHKQRIFMGYSYIIAGIRKEVMSMKFSRVRRLAMTVMTLIVLCYILMTQPGCSVSIGTRSRNG